MHSVFGKSIFKSYSGFINLFSRVADPLVVVIAAIAAYFVRFPFNEALLPHDYRSLVLFAIFCVVIIFPSFGLYASWRGQSLLKQARSIFLAWLTVVLLMIIILFSLKISADYSRLWLGWWMMLGLASLLTFRMFIFGFLQYQRMKGKNFRRVIVVGAGDLGERLINQVNESPWMGFNIVALFDDDEHLHGEMVGEYKVTGGISDVEAFFNNGHVHVDEVWIALPLRAEQRVKELLYELRHHPVNIKLIPDIFGFSLLNHSMTEIAGLPAVNLSDTPMGGSNQLIKAIEDRLLALCIFILICPLLLAISIAIKAISPGPILFKQRRHGWDGRIINVYKFRTMEVHAEDEGCITQASKNDSRITPLGAFLRRTSLDELPQFYNVMQGRMSIVGPRPHAVQHNEMYKDQVNKYMLRHMVKPGITGWAQVNGYRGETDTLDKMKKRVEFDLFYIENWSLWFDLKIIFLTIFKGFVGKNAY
ncbi:MAG: undecaprenyl-phosphate glucose phosphotransferase [endosymbiont of Galathealinum brachiosum]|uniref:Undecaprenyl-phosphate glucose phosphotransferase n=1 Tax=endosymbiont of Galathealinum brachiosum TaxID=2200906 RepID=A0A370DA88_9GAMM|nr:MAG: undecaprenyl-phosphate glucose phosphotransferase [endosymbiont of Galathealinum brachiosum]